MLSMRPSVLKIKQNVETMILELNISRWHGFEAFDRIVELADKENYRLYLSAKLWSLILVFKGSKKHAGELLDTSLLNFDLHIYRSQKTVLERMNIVREYLDEQNPDLVGNKTLQHLSSLKVLISEESKAGGLNKIGQVPVKKNQTGPNIGLSGLSEEMPADVSELVKETGATVLEVNTYSRTTGFASYRNSLAEIGVVFHSSAVGNNEAGQISVFSDTAGSYLKVDKAEYQKMVKQKLYLDLATGDNVEQRLQELQVQLKTAEELLSSTEKQARQWKDLASRYWQRCSSQMSGEAEGGQPQYNQFDPARIKKEEEYEVANEENISQSVSQKRTVRREW